MTRKRTQELCGLPQPALEAIHRDSGLLLAAAQLSSGRHPHPVEPLSGDQMRPLSPADLQMVRKAPSQGGPLLPWKTSQSSPWTCKGWGVERELRALGSAISSGQGREEERLPSILPAWPCAGALPDHADLHSLGGVAAAAHPQTKLSSVFWGS